MGAKYAEQYINGHQANIFAYPIVKFMEELAYKSLIQGKSIEDSLLSEILSHYEADITKGLDSSPDPIITVIAFGILRLDKTSNPRNPKYIFTDFSFHEFMAASYLKNQLISEDIKIISAARLFISSHCDNEQYLQTMKFLAGLITMHNDEEQKHRAMQLFLNSIISSDVENLKIGGDNEALLIMHLLSQTIKNAKIDTSVPTILIDNIESIILKNLDKWETSLINSQYSSDRIINEIIRMLEIDDKTTFLTLVRILPSLNIRNLEQKNTIATLLISKRYHIDLEVAEKSIRALQSMIDCSGVKQALSELVMDRRLNIALVAIEILSKLDEPNFIDTWIELLNSSEDWVIFSAIDALESSSNSRFSSERIIPELLLKLSDRNINKEFIFNKSLKALKYFGYNTNQIVKLFISKINGASIDSAIDALVNLANNHIETEEIHTVIQAMLSRIFQTKGGLFGINKDYPIRIKLIEALSEIFKNAESISQENIYQLLNNQINNSREFSVVNAALEALGKIFNLLESTKKVIIINHSIKMIQTYEDIRYVVMGSLFLSKKFNILDHQTQKNILITINSNKIISSLINIAYIGVPKEQVISAIQTLGTLYSHLSSSNKESLLSALISKFSDPKFDQVQTIVIEVWVEIFSLLSPNRKLQVLNLLTDNIFLHQKAKTASIQALTKLDFSLIDASRQSKLIELISSNDQNARLMALKAFIELYDTKSAVMNNALRHFIDLAQSTDHFTSIKKYGAIEVIGVLISSYDYPIDLINSAYNILIRELQIHNHDTNIGQISIITFAKIIDKIPESTIRELPTILLDLRLPEDPSEIRKSIKRIFINNLKNQALDPHNINIINNLAMKYTNDGITTSTEDKIIINSLVDIIYLLSLQTNSQIMHNRFYNLLSRAKYNDNLIIDILSNELDDYKDTQDKSHIFSITKMLFGKNYSLIDKLDEFENSFNSALNRLELEKTFPTIEHIIAHLDSFAELVIDKNLDIRITRDNFYFGNQKYSLGKATDIESQLTDAEEIFKAISKHHKMLIKIDTTSVKHIFSEITNHEYLTNSEIQLALLQEYTDTWSLADIFLIISYKTIFGDILIKKIAIVNEKINFIIHSNIEPNYRQLIFGEPSEYKKYDIKITYINSEEHLTLLTALQNCYSKEELFSKAIRALSQTHTDLIDYDWKDSISISHNGLIQYQGLEERMSSLENSFNTLREQLNDEMHQLQLSQETITKIMSSLRSKYNIEYPTNLNSYQKSLYITLVHEFMELYIAAMATQTGIVSNSRTGIVGSIGTLFSRISAHVPIAGAAVDLLGCILNSVDSHIQMTILSNIANLAIDPMAMAELAKAFALRISTSKLNRDELTQISIIESINNILTFSENIKSKIITHIVNMVSTQFDQNSEDMDKNQGINDAKRIITIVTNIVAAGNFELDFDWHHNFNKLQASFNNKYIIHSSNALVVAIEDNNMHSPSTPKVIKDLTTNAKLIAEAVIKKIPLLFEKHDVVKNIILDDFITILTDALIGERYEKNQLLIYFSTLNNSLRNALVTQLAYTLKKRNIFQLIDDSVSINEKFISDGLIFHKAIQKARKYLVTQHYRDRNDEIITIEYTPDINLSSESLDATINNSPIRSRLSTAASFEDKNLIYPTMNLISSDQNLDIVNSDSLELRFVNSFTSAAPSTNIALTGGALISVVESVPAAKYLFNNYLPILPLIKDWWITKAISAYEHPIGTVLHFVGNLMITYAALKSPIYAVVSSSIFYAKPVIYQYRDQSLSSISYLETNEWMKFSAYLGTDVIISIAIALPFITTISSATLSYLAIQSIAKGAVNYYNAHPHETGINGNILAFITTSAAAVPCAKIVMNHDAIEIQIIVASSCVIGLASVHYFSKFAGDYISGAEHQLLGANGSNSMAEEL